MQVVPPTAASQNRPFLFRTGSLRRSSIFAALSFAFSALVILSLAGCGVTYNTLPLTVSPNSVSFGTVQIGKSQAETVTLQNPGLTAVTLSGLQAADPAFQVSSAQTNTTIAAGGSVTVSITFAPTAAKDYSSKITITSGMQQSEIAVSGTGKQAPPVNLPPTPGSPAIQLSSTTLQFGSVPIGGNAQQSLTVTSSGTAPLSISALKTSGSGFSAQMPALPLSLNPGQSLTLPVKFGPQASGSHTGQIVIGSDAVGASSLAVALLGSGTQSAPPPITPGTPALSLSSTSVDFGSVTVGSQAAQSVTLTSSGTADVVIQSLAVKGDPFAIGKMKTPLTLAPGQQVVLPLSFAPSSASAQQGQVTLTDNASGSPNSIRLSGTGTVAATASLSVPASVDFGDVTVGTPGSRTITLVSNGTAPVTIKSLKLAGAAFSEFQQTLPQVLQPNQQMSLKVKFTPTGEGNATGSIMVSSDATNPSAMIQMQGNGIAAPAPALSASATSLSFGQVDVGSKMTKSVTVTSTGTAAASITAGSVSGTGYTATYAGVPVQNLAAPITLQPGQNVSFDVVFDPATSGDSTGQLSLSTDTGSPVSVALSGNGTNVTSPALTLSAPSLDFGNVQMGSQKAVQLTLTSSGTAPVTISSGAVSGKDFQLTSATYPSGVTGWPATLQPGQQVVLSITFSPDAVDSFTGNLALTSDASGGSVNVPLSGTGDAVPTAALTLSASSIDFGQVSLGSKGTQSLTLTSTGNAPLNISAITLSGSQFSVNPQSLPVTLQPNQKVKLTLTFTPTAEGQDTGTLTVTSNDSSGPATVSLGGTGTAAPSPQLTVGASSLPFGNVPVSTTATLPLTLTSTGSAPLTINSAKVSGTGFTASGVTFPVTLNPNQAVTLNVKFNPQAAGDATGQLTISSNGSGGATSVVQLSGTGTAVTVPQLQVGATSLAFGNVAVDSTATLPLTLTSTGTAALTINSANVSGTGFTASGVNFPVTLNPNQAVTLNVKFNPQAAGDATGQLTISSNGSGGATTVVQLSGTGTATTPTVATLQIGTTSLAFGDVAVSSTKTLPLTLISSGTAPLTISSVALQGSGFSDSGATFPMTLNPNQSVTLNVQFDPTASGAASGQLTINSNSSTGAQTQIAITGNGTATQHEIDLSWDAPTGSSDPVAGYNIYRSTDGGGSFSKLNTSAESQEAYTDSNVQSGSTYVYEVKSVDANGVESTPSNQITLSVP